MLENGQRIEEEDAVFKIEDNNIIITGVINAKHSRMILENFFSQANHYIIHNNYKCVKVDISELKFLNSSGIRAIVSWIIKLGTLPDEQKYKMTFLYNPYYSWQESSIDTLMFLNKKFIKKEAVEK